MVHAAGTFTVKSWDESTYQELDGNAKLTKARIIYQLTGDLRAESTSDTLMCYADDGTAVYTGLDRLVGQLDGRSGSFVVLATGDYSGGVARITWRVVEGSGTGELAGLRGTGSAAATSEPPGTFSLDYELG
jgi:Protein of unknown function (DUF3224)